MIIILKKKMFFCSQSHMVIASSKYAHWLQLAMRHITIMA
jgi:hypothetical protein